MGVRAFRDSVGHEAVVRGVDVSLPCPRGRKDRRQPGADRRRLWVQAGERVGSEFHELRAAGSSEELLDRGHGRADVDQRAGRDRVQNLLGGHALAHGAFHAGRPVRTWPLDKFADGADAAVREKLSMSSTRRGSSTGSPQCRRGLGIALVEGGDRYPTIGDVSLKGRGGVGRWRFLCDLVATDLCQIVATKSK